jgi:quercetin dioxygenase-like cupin family protein
VEYRKLHDIPRQPTPLGGQARVLVDNIHARVVLLDIAPGQEVAAHQAPVEVTLVVLKGRGWVECAGQRRQCQEGDVIVFPAGASRAIAASADAECQLLVVRTPNPG